MARTYYLSAVNSGLTGGPQFSKVLSLNTETAGTLSIFNVDFFNKNNEYVSIEQVQSMYNMVYNMALTYKKQTPFVWINTIIGEHVLTYQSNNPFGLLMKKFLPVIYKI